MLKVFEQKLTKLANDSNQISNRNVEQSKGAEEKKNCENHCKNFKSIVV